MQLSEKNHTLNYLKALACFCVIMLHCGLPGIVGKLLYGPSRFAVPVFFMISGYFVYNANPITVENKLPRKIKHIAVLLIATEIIYLIWHLIQYAIIGGEDGIREWFFNMLSFKKLIQCIFFQTTPIGDVSWFMVALLLCYVFTFPIAHYNLWKMTTNLIPILLAINIIVGEILPFAGVNVQWYWCSNLWVLGFPFYAMGYWIKVNQKQIDKVTNRTLVLLILISLFIITGERLLTDASQLFIGNILLAIALFVLCIRNPVNLKKYTFVDWIGDKAFYVYIFHPIARDIYDMIIGVYKNIPIIMWIRPFVVFVVCILIAWVVDTIKKLPSYSAHNT